MGHFLENLYDVLFHPADAMRRLAAHKPVGEALAAFLLSVLIPAGVVYFAFKEGSLTKMLNTILLLQIVGGLFLWFSGSAILSLIAEFFGGRGTAMGLFVALGFAQLPRIMVAPLGVLVMLLPPGVFTFGAVLMSLVILFWILALDVAAIKGAHELSSAKAVLVLVTPLLAITAAALFAIVFIGTVCLLGWF